MEGVLSIEQRVGEKRPCHSPSSHLTSMEKREEPVSPSGTKPQRGFSHTAVLSTGPLGGSDAGSRSATPHSGCHSRLLDKDRGSFYGIFINQVGGRATAKPARQQLQNQTPKMLLISDAEQNPTAAPHRLALTSQNCSWQKTETQPPAGPRLPGTRLSHSTNTSLAWVFRGGTMMVRGFPVQ